MGTIPVFIVALDCICVLALFLIAFNIHLRAKPVKKIERDYSVHRTAKKDSKYIVRTVSGEFVRDYPVCRKKFKELEQCEPDTVEISFYKKPTGDGYLAVVEEYMPSDFFNGWKDPFAVLAISSCTILNAVVLIVAHFTLVG